MQRVILTTLSCIILLLLSGGTDLFADESKKEKAINAALQWLRQVDEGQAAESWEDAAAYFKNAITKENWVQTLNAVRTPLGKLIRRQIIGSVYKTALPGAPDGEYVVIQFSTVYENKKSAVETVTPMRQKDGSWRVSGYYIK